MKHIISLIAVTCLACSSLYGPTEELFGAYNFRVEIEGIAAGAFQEVSGLGAEIEIIEYQDGSDLVLRKRPGRTKYSNITLKRGYVGNSAEMDWFEQLTGGATQMRSMAILLEDDAGAELGRWNFFDCWPSSWKVTGVRTGGMTLVEEIQMVVGQVAFEAP